MNKQAKLIHDLRSLVKDGATPSRLIRHILSELGEKTSQSDLQKILMQAFQLPIVQISPYSTTDQKGIVLNRTLLPEIVGNRNLWDTEKPSASNGHVSWLDGLHVQHPGDAMDKLMSTPYPGISEQSWAALHPEEQNGLFLQLASSRVLSDRVELLSRLAERLQEKIDELERKLK